MEVVDGRGVEDPVGQGAVIGLAVTEPGEDRVYFGGRVGAVQMVGDSAALCPAPRTTNRKAARGRVQPHEVVSVVELCRTARDLEPAGHARHQARGEHQVSGLPDDQFALLLVTGDDLEVGDDPVLGDRPGGDHLVAVADQVAQLARAPGEVVVELHP